MSTVADSIASQDDEKEGKRHSDAWKVLLPLAGAALVYFAYLSGVAYQQTYLAQFSIDQGQFPLGKSDYLILAVLAVMRDLSIVLKSVLTSKAIMVSLLVFLGAGTISFILVEVIRKLARTHLSRKPISVRAKLAALYFLALPIGGAYATFTIPIVLAMVFVVPIQIGVAAAISIAKDDIADFEKGCAAHPHGKHCFNLVDEKGTVAAGFIIEQSKESVAIWDEGTIKVLPLEKRGLISVDPM